jgi:predicted MFS family arabinose efflux permease
VSSLRTALVFATAIAVVNGFGRFAYALLLPVMRDDLRWDYALSGWLNTANSVGYGVGALAGMWLLSRSKPATLFVAGLAMTVVTLVLCGFTRDVMVMMGWRFLTGVGSAWVFACGGALVAAHYASSPGKAAAAVALYYAGGGLGIAGSGLLLYPVLAQVQAWTWPVGWLVLALAAFLLSLWPAKLALRMGGEVSSATTQPLAWQPFLRRFKGILLAYFLFGVGYIVYMTFVIAWLREMRYAAAASVGVWLVVGAASMASGFVWRGAMTRWWPASTFAAAALCTAVGSVLPLAGSHVALLLVSAVLVGGSFFMVPAAVLALARNTLPAAHWARVMNFFTFVFALGQAVGPVAAGWVADTHGLSAAMLAAAAVLVAAAGLAFLQGRARFA